MNNDKNISTQAISSEKAKMLRRISRKYETVQFREYLKQAKDLIIAGNSLFEVQERLNIKKRREWDDIKFALAQAYIRPENIAMEWMIRQDARYKMAANIYSLAQKANDYEGMAKGLMMMLKVDEHGFEIKRALGLIKPIALEDEKDPEVGGQGYSSDEVIDVEARLRRKFNAGEGAEQPQPIILIDRPDPGREADQLGQDSLDQGSTPRQESKDSI